MKTALLITFTVLVVVAFVAIMFYIVDRVAETESELKTTLDVTFVKTVPEETAPAEKETTAEIEPVHFLSPVEFETACHIVEGEASDQDYTGKALVAECLLNACDLDGIEPTEARVRYKYAGWSETVTEDTIKAVIDVFTHGILPTDRHILYFYDPRYCESTWHETQIFVTEYGCHRFFERRS